jgi:hypothetical protein
MAYLKKATKAVKERRKYLFSGADFPDRQVPACLKCGRLQLMELADLSMLCMTCDREKAVAVHRKSVEAFSKADRIKAQCKEDGFPIAESFEWKGL